MTRTGASSSQLRWAILCGWLVPACLVLAVLITPNVSSADAPRPAWSPSGRVSVSLPSGAGGPLVLHPGPGGYVGEMVVKNLGEEPLAVTRVAVLGDEDDPRSPSHVSVRFSEGAATRATLGPGASRTLAVAWSPPSDARVRQAFGHIVITSTDESTGEVTMGFCAQTPTGLGWVGEHALSSLLLWPLIGLGLAGMITTPLRSARAWAWRCSVGVGVLQLGLAVWAFRRFVPDMTEKDGNEGFQLIERAVWVRSAGIEWYLGVDGASMPLVLLAAIAFLAAVLLSGGDRRSAPYYIALALFQTGVTGVLVSLDLALLFACFALAFTALALLVFKWGSTQAAAAASKLSVYAIVATVGLLLAVTALSRASGAAYLGDGTATAHTMAIPELARTSYASKAVLFGASLASVAWLLLVVVVAVVSPVVPLHGWLADVLEQAPVGAAVFVGGAMTSLGPYLLVRLGLWAMPEGARWAGASVAALGALSALWGSLCAMVQSDVRRFVAYASVVSAGMCLYGAGQLTPLGVAGAGVGLFAHGLSAVLLMGLASALSTRMRTLRAARLSGLAGEAPLLAAVGVVGLAVSVGAPGSIGAWPLLLDLLGGFTRAPALALVFAAALVVSVSAHMRVAGDILLSGGTPVWRDSPSLELLKGRLPDATPRELLALVPVAVLAVVLGLWPAPVLTPVVVRAHDSGTLLGDR